MKISILVKKLNRVISDSGDLNWPVDWLFSKKLLDLMEDTESNPKLAETEQPSAKNPWESVQYFSTPKTTGNTIERLWEGDEIACGCVTEKDDREALAEGGIVRQRASFSYPVSDTGPVHIYPDLSEQYPNLIPEAVIGGKLWALTEVLGTVFDYSLENKKSEEGDETWELFSNKRAKGVVAHYSNLNEAVPDLRVILEGKNVLNRVLPDDLDTATLEEIQFIDEESN
jgi:hypothetical protein